jgi:hypothetical protein
MENWHFLFLGDAMMAHGPSEQIREEFQPLFESSGEPSDMAIFTRTDSENRLQCEIFVYFSPAAADIAKRFDAKPCERPLKKGLDLLAGNPNSLSVLFP